MRRWATTPPGTARDRARAVSRSFFLHYHATRIHPVSLTPWYTLGLGLMSLFLFGLLTVTGILLMIYYTPSVERAYASINDIDAVVAGGGLVRAMHRWAGHGMVLTVVLHMVRVFYTGSYARGRALNWMIGLLLLLTTLVLSFSGYLLPWDQLAFWAVTVGVNIAASFRELTDAFGVTHLLDPGGLVTGVLLGGETVGQDALNRFYLLHVVLLPLVTGVLVAVHVWRIRKDGGLSRPDDADGRMADRNAGPERGAQGTPADVRGEVSLLSWPVAFWAELSVLLLCTAAVLLSALLIDAPLREVADPSMPENPMKAPWYFLGVQELVSYSAFAGGILIPLLLMMGLALIPILDREATGFGLWWGGEVGRRWFSRSLVFAAVVTGGIILVGATTGWVRDWIPGTPALVNMAVNQGSVVAVLYALWCRHAYVRSGSTRIAAIAFFTCSLVGVALFTIVGLWLRGADWRFVM